MASCWDVTRWGPSTGVAGKQHPHLLASPAPVCTRLLQGGGNCGNALTAAARLGLHPTIVTKIGGDGVGDGILAGEAHEAPCLAPESFSAQQEPRAKVTRLLSAATLAPVTARHRARPQPLPLWHHPCRVCA